MLPTVSVADHTADSSAAVATAAVAALVRDSWWFLSSLNDTFTLMALSTSSATGV